MATSFDTSETAILSRALATETGAVTPELAKHLLKIGLTEADRKHAQELARRAKETELSETEAVELENYRRAGRIFELLKSQARIALRQAQQNS